MRNFAFSGILIFSSLTVGCQKFVQESAPDPKLRTVQTALLKLDNPPESELVSGSVASWKTEQIGFEVSGRLEWVAEPKTLVLIPNISTQKTNASVQTPETLVLTPETLVKGLSNDETKNDLLVRGAGDEVDQDTNDSQGEYQLQVKIDTPAVDRAIRNVIDSRVKSEQDGKNVVEADLEFLNVVNPDKAATNGTIIAEVENEQYQLKVEIATVGFVRSIQEVIAQRIKIERSLDSQMNAAKAERVFRKAEKVRTESILTAVSKSESERVEADWQRATAEEQELAATIATEKSILKSLELEIKNTYQSLLDARRQLRDCTLYSSFPGQVAEISVVPGSFVSVGTPVATIQLMNPIKVELEVSAEDSLRLSKRIKVPVLIGKPGGKEHAIDAFVYLVDPVADPLTRTFTVTLLILNKKTTIWSENNKDLPAMDRPRWLDLPFIPGADFDGENWYVDEEVIHQDGDGYFLWRIMGITKKSDLPKDGKVNVTKMRVNVGESRLSFLGNWWFRQIRLVPDENPAFDPAVDVVAGTLTFHPEASEDGDTWDGDQILVNRDSKYGGAWMLRPGDVVRVDLGGRELDQGFFVPMDAIVRRNGEYNLFTIDPSTISKPSEDMNEYLTAKVKLTPITVVDESDDSTSSEREIESPENGTPLADLQYVTAGTHYLSEGDEVNLLKLDKVSFPGESNSPGADE